MQDCHIHNFLTPPFAMGLQEIKPQNVIPYKVFMHKFLQNYGHLLSYINTAADYQDYEKPIHQAMGPIIDFLFSLPVEINRKLVFEQLVVETHDGYLRRSVREDRKMQFKHTITNAKKRKNLTDPFGSFEISLSNDVMKVQRIYPNLISLFSEVGSLAKVVIVVCLIIGYFHNELMLELFVLNTAVEPGDINIVSAAKKSPQNSESEQVTENSLVARPYRYSELISIKYCFCTRDP
jgi:hypothetical protein